MILSDSFAIIPGVVVPAIFELRFDNLQNTFRRNSTEFIYLQNNNRNINALVCNITTNLEKALNAAYATFVQDRVKKGVLKVPVAWMQTDEGQKEIQGLMRERFAPWFQATSSAVMPLTNQQEYTENMGGTQPRRDNGNESKNLFADICQTVAMAYNIPLNVLLGNTADMDSNIVTLLTLCVNPIAKQIEGEINRTFYSREQYNAGNRVEMDLSNVKVTSLIDQAHNMDVLFRMGYSVNDILRAMGKTEIREEWANAHYVTKNYDRVKEDGGGHADDSENTAADQS